MSAVWYSGEHSGTWMRAFRLCVGSIVGLGSYSIVFQNRLGPTKPGVARVDLVMSITLQSSSFSMYSQKPVWIYRDKRKFEYTL